MDVHVYKQLLIFIVIAIWLCGIMSMFTIAFLKAKNEIEPEKRFGFQSQCNGLILVSSFSFTFLMILMLSNLLPTVSHTNVVLNFSFVITLILALYLGHQKGSTST